jgi:indolepyruvate ferredoxin oxidoreductase, beta subunit
MDNGQTQNVLIVGVGGQGVLTASDILANVCLAHGYDVKKSEVHGMAKRGGVVYSHVRYGRGVLSPLIEPGQGDVLLAFEPAEALRWSPYLKASGTLISNLRQRVPPASCLDRRPEAALRYPQEIERSLRQRVSDVRMLDAETLALDLGNRRVSNTVLLGVLSNVCEFSAEDWLSAIAKSVKPQARAVNREAFLAGRNLQFVTADSFAAPPSIPIPCSAVTAAPSIEIRETWCKGCEICVMVCPQSCLQMNSAKKAVVTKADACIRCMLCEWLCPDLAVEVR